MTLIHILLFVLQMFALFGAFLYLTRAPSRLRRWWEIDRHFKAEGLPVPRRADD